jgi:hypothetical protein
MKRRSAEGARRGRLMRRPQFRLPPHRVSRFPRCTGFWRASRFDYRRPALQEFWAKVAEGISPKSALYSAARRPNCQKPYRLAVSVTVVLSGLL